MSRTHAAIRTNQSTENKKRDRRKTSDVCITNIEFNSYFVKRKNGKGKSGKRRCTLTSCPDIRIFYNK